MWPTIPVQSPTKAGNEIHEVTSRRANNGWIIYVERSDGSRDGPFVYTSHKEYAEKMRDLVDAQGVRRDTAGATTVG